MTSKTIIMRKLAVVLGVLVMGFTTNAQDAQGATITVTVENVLSDGGTILAGLHTAETFMKGNGVASAIAPAKTGEVTLTFENVAPGTYAVMVMHDVNDNKQMDFDSTGMPIESYGQTGNTNPYGPPVFTDSKFEVNGEDQEFRIRF